MPTYKAETRFLREFDRLSAEDQEAFLSAVEQFVEDPRRGTFRQELRIKRFRGPDNLWEMTWADHGGALFTYGKAVHPGEPHVIWLRIGGHEIVDEQ